MNRQTCCAQAARRHRRLARQLHRCERRRLADRPAFAGCFAGAPPGGTRPSQSTSAAITACSAAWSARQAPARLRRGRRAHQRRKDSLPQLLLLLGRREAPSLRRLSRRREGGSAAMGKDGVAAPQARSVARAPRPPSWVQRACLTELLGSRFAQCAAAGRRGYCRPAASSSAAARGSRLQHGTRPMCAHACSALSAASLRRWRCPVAATVAALPEFFAGTLGDPSRFCERACLDSLDSCQDKTTSSNFKFSSSLSSAV